MFTDLIQLEDELDKFLYDFGFQAVDLQLNFYGKARTFRLFIDRIDGSPVSIDDLSSVAPQVRLMLEAKELYNDNSSIELSSAGLDRILKRNRDFTRFLGQPVKVKYFSGSEKQFLKGELTSFNDEMLVITTSDADGNRLARQVSRGNLTRVNLVPQLEI